MDEDFQTNLEDFSTENEIDSKDTLIIDSENSPPRQINMPSIKKFKLSEEKSDYIYHDLGILYPHPPIPDESQGVVLRRAKLVGISGVNEILNWVAEKSAVVVNLDHIISNEDDLNFTVDAFSTFVAINKIESLAFTA